MASLKKGMKGIEQFAISDISTPLRYVIAENCCQLSIMSHLSLRTKDLQFERSKVRHGGVHNFEGFTKSPTAADRALLYKGSPSTSHVFGHSTALENKTYLQEQNDNFDSIHSL